MMAHEKVPRFTSLPSKSGIANTICFGNLSIPLIDPINLLTIELVLHLYNN